MEPFTLSKNSIWVRFYEMWKWESQPHIAHLRDVCAFRGSFLFAFFLKALPIIGLITLIMTGVPIAGYLMAFTDTGLDFSSMDAFMVIWMGIAWLTIMLTGVLIAAAAFMAACVGVSIGVKWLWYRYRPTPTYRERKPSIVATAYRGWREKFCTPLQIVDENGERVLTWREERERERERYMAEYAELYDEDGNLRDDGEIGVDDELNEALDSVLDDLLREDPAAGAVPGVTGTNTPDITPDEPKAQP